MCNFAKIQNSPVSSNTAGYSRFPEFFISGDLYLTTVC